MKKFKEFKISTNFLLEKFFIFEKIKSLSSKQIPHSRNKDEGNEKFLNKIFYESLIYHNNFINELLGNEKKCDSGVIQIIEADGKGRLLPLLKMVYFFIQGIYANLKG